MKDKAQHIKYWCDTAKDDWESIGFLFDWKKYVQALFFVHLALEKILKAHWVKNNENNFPPKTHNLIYLYENAGVILSDEDTDFLQMMNTYQIESRYPDYLTQLNRGTSKEQTEEIITLANQIFKCLQEKLP